MGLHVDLDKVFRDNAKKLGPDVQRKNKFIINTGNNLTAENREIKIKQNKLKYGLSNEYIKSLRLPKAQKRSRKGEVVLSLEQIFHVKSNFSIVEKLHHLQNLKSACINK
jgi:hypothetical protein